MLRFDLSRPNALVENEFGRITAQVGSLVLLLSVIYVSDLHSVVFNARVRHSILRTASNSIGSRCTRHLTAREIIRVIVVTGIGQREIVIFFAELAFTFPTAV